MAHLQLVDDDEPNSPTRCQPATIQPTIVLIVATAVTVIAIGATVLNLATAAHDLLASGVVAAWVVYAIRLAESAMHRRMDRIEQRAHAASYAEGYVEGYTHGIRREQPQPSRAVRPV
jgi:ABC-type transport system involved in cytochrome bd biosynthesis fused ATPase/permease subunit